MNHGKALAIKAVIVLPVVWIVLTLFNNASFLDSTITGIVLLILAYGIGDLVMVPKTGNIVSTVADMGLAFLVTWGMLAVFGYNEVILPAIVTAVIVAIGEYFFHIYLLKTEFNNPNHSTHSGITNATK